jgi:malate synthase
VQTKNEILTPEACSFLTKLARHGGESLKTLLENRKKRQATYDAGALPTFDPNTKHIRESEWKVAEIPHDIIDRRVEITGPPDRKMVINALNSGANVFMADFEDSLCPTWEAVVEGQKNLLDANKGTIRYRHPTKGVYKLNEDVAVLFVRPRGLHLKESNFEVDGEAIPASLFDFGLYMFHNANLLVDKSKSPYFYLPKLEHYTEAAWWNGIFAWAQDELNIPQGTIRATVLVETLPASFQMNEILWELKDHSAGLNCGRWDYIFSYIKTLRSHKDRVTPNRAQIGMDTPFMKAYAKAVVQTCHRRGVHAMGGMAAQIPIRNDPSANELAMAKVSKDKELEVSLGHDGTWVAHPGLVKLAKDIFDEYMPAENQIDRKTNYDAFNGESFLQHPRGTITLDGLRQNVDVGVRYLAAWLGGLGCVPLYNLMEDAATAEISRTQVWQWVHHNATLETGESVTISMVRKMILELGYGDPSLIDACEMFLDLCSRAELVNFLTLGAYEVIANDKQ